MNNTQKESMQRACMSFLALTGKPLTTAEGFRFLSLWEMAQPDEERPAPIECLIEKADHIIALLSETAKAQIETTAITAQGGSSFTAALLMAEKAEPVAHRKVLHLNRQAAPVRTDSMTLSSRGWQDGYPFKLDVIPYDADLSHEAYGVHFRTRPTPWEIQDHYRLYLEGTHKVMLWENVDGGRNISHTLSGLYSCTAKPQAQTKKQTSAIWPQGATHRLCYVSRFTDETEYQYFDFPPQPADLSKAQKRASGQVLTEQRGN